MSQSTQNRPTENRSNQQTPTQDLLSSHEGEGDFQEMCDTVYSAVKSYGSHHPAVITSFVFITGFYIGWKVKPW
jgi:hypothetical protein